MSCYGTGIVLLLSNFSAASETRVLVARFVAGPGTCRVLVPGAPARMKKTPNKQRNVLLVSKRDELRSPMLSHLFKFPPPPFSPRLGCARTRARLGRVMDTDPPFSSPSPSSPPARWDVSGVRGEEEGERKRAMTISRLSHHLRGRCSLANSWMEGRMDG